MPENNCPTVPYCPTFEGRNVNEHKKNIHEKQINRNDTDG